MNSFDQAFIRAYQKEPPDGRRFVEGLSSAANVPPHVGPEGNRNSAHDSEWPSPPNVANPLDPPGGPHRVSDPQPPWRPDQGPLQSSTHLAWPNDRELPDLPRHHHQAQLAGPAAQPVAGETTPHGGQVPSSPPLSAGNQDWILPPTMSATPATPQIDRSLFTPPQERTAQRAVRLDDAQAPLPAPHYHIAGQPAQGPMAHPACEPSAWAAPRNATAIPPTIPPVGMVPPVPAGNQQHAPFRAAWEVDRFQWPTVCDMLVEENNQMLFSLSSRILAAAQHGLSISAVSSFRRKEGRTTLALCLARTLARTVRVLLVDGDFHNPQIARQLGLQIPCGWESAIAGESSLEETAVVSLDDGFSLLPVCRIPLSRATSVTDPQATSHLRYASASFDVVLIDAPPAGISGNSLTTAVESCGLDGVILVQDVRRTIRNEVHQLVRRLRRDGVEAWGIAENFDDPADVINNSAA